MLFFVCSIHCIGHITDLEIVEEFQSTNHNKLHTIYIFFLVGIESNFSCGLIFIYKKNDLPNSIWYSTKFHTQFMSRERKKKTLNFDLRNVIRHVFDISNELNISLKHQWWKHLKMVLINLRSLFAIGVMYISSFWVRLKFRKRDLFKVIFIIYHFFWIIYTEFYRILICYGEIGRRSFDNNNNHSMDCWNWNSLFIWTEWEISESEVKLF